MQDLAALPKDQLLDLFKQQEAALGQKIIILKTKDNQLAIKDEQLAEKVNELATKDDKIATKADVIKQLEQQIKDMELAYDKLWRERFESRSERYIGDPAQMRLDFGDTDDAAEGLADAVDEADLIPLTVAANLARNEMKACPRIYLATK